MAIELINIGQIANDGTGDDLREAFVKVNRNFEDLDLRDNEKTTVTNTGTGIGIFDNIVNYDIRLKSLVAGDNMVIDATPNGDILIASDTNAFTEITLEVENGEKTYLQNQNIKIHGGVGIDVVLNEENGFIYVQNLFNDKLVNEDDPKLSANLDADDNDILAVNTIQARTFLGNVTGNVTGLINGYDPSTIGPYFDQYFDFGNIGRTVDSIIDWMLEEANVDFGTFALPDPRTIDLGSIA